MYTHTHTHTHTGTCTHSVFTPRPGAKRPGVEVVTTLKCVPSPPARVAGETPQRLQGGSGWACIVFLSDYTAGDNSFMFGMKVLIGSVSC